MHTNTHKHTHTHTLFGFLIPFICTQLISKLPSVTSNNLRLFINTNTSRFHWTTSTDQTVLKQNEFRLDIPQLLAWIEALIKNTIVTHNGQIYSQDVGMPMGTNCAVNLATFLLYSYEFQFLTQKLITFDYTSTQKIRFTRRFLDDITTINNPQFESYQYDIYPEAMLTLNLENQHLPLHCLDVHFYFHTKKHCIATKLHSKRDDPKFYSLPFTRYPHPNSFICRAILYNTFTTELHRIHSVNTFFDTFATDVIFIINYLITKGYTRHRLHQKLRRFIQHHQPFLNSTNPEKSTATIWNRIMP
jgi:hypothetical protein